ncbi:hypothetical protein B0O99DRAFT_658179 [Bisporella sp. PMI_857]|nr:hypothetical protein B0O99DRAFT_658179 [Bisporella sp. PMI_857]
MSFSPSHDVIHEYPESSIDQPPPPYEFISSTANVRFDGRVDIDLDSGLYKRLSKLISVPIVDGNIELTPELHERPTPAEIRLNICIQVVGSRGDVQPFVALGNELQKFGHRVRVATHDVFEKFVRDSGLEFYPIGGDPVQLMAFMVKNPGLIPNIETLRSGEIQQKRRMISEMLTGCWNSCIRPDQKTGMPFVAEAIIANPPSFAHVHCAQALRIPLHVMFTMPWTSTRAFSHPLANLKGSRKDLQVENYVSYLLVEWLTWQGLGDLINKFRKSIDLEAIPFTEGPLLLETLNIPFTYCWSPALVPKPRDWPAHIDVCGFFFRDPPQYSPPDDLQQFLQAGPPPIYIGFGSIVVDDPEKLSATIVEAVNMAGVRAIVSRGWSKLNSSSQSSNIFYIGDCPHEWLFQQVAAVVHHGGAGTTACGLRYGKPTTIVPFFGDQPFWGSMIEAAGAGPAPIPHKQLNKQVLADAMLVCLQPETQVAAQDIAKRMSSEQGVSAAARSFHAALPMQHMRCDVLPDLPAAWTYKTKERKFKLSKKAAQILVNHSLIEADKLKSYATNLFFIENRRWDPVTATTSSGIATGVGMLKGVAGIVSNPYNEYKKSRSLSHVPEPITDPLLLSPSAEASKQDSSSQFLGADTRSSALATNMSDRSGLRIAGAMGAASAKGVGTFFGHYAKGTVVDIPLAFTEGMRGLPKLYGEEIKEHGQIVDWKSGMIEGGKWFGKGLAGGVADLFVQPYKGAKKEGPWGAVKGLGKGAVGWVAKTSSGATAIVAYPGQGICKSIFATVHSNTSKGINSAIRQEMLTLRMDGKESVAIIEAFEDMRLV